jgi:hypothetical protein
VLVPGVERILEHGAGERPYLALRSPGRSLARALDDARGLDPATCRAWCVEVCQLLSAVARSGVELSDADPNRFSVDAAFRLWLVDPWGAVKSTPDNAESAHLKHADALCRAIANSSRARAFSAAALEALDRSTSFAELVGALES